MSVDAYYSLLNLIVFTRMVLTIKIFSQYFSPYDLYFDNFFPYTQVCMIYINETEKRERRGCKSDIKRKRVKTAKSIYQLRYRLE